MLGARNRSQVLSQSNMYSNVKAISLGCCLFGLVFGMKYHRAAQAGLKLTIPPQAKCCDCRLANHAHIAHDPSVSTGQGQGQEGENLDKEVVEESFEVTQ